MRKILLTLLDIYNTPVVDDKQSTTTNEPAAIVTSDVGNIGETIFKCVALVAVIALIAIAIILINKKK